MDIEQIKQAVAAVTPCTWTVHCEETPDKAAAKHELSFLIDQTGPFIGKTYLLAANGKCVATTGCGPNSEAHANYLQVINPVAVAKLVNELETLQEENAELIIGISRLSEDEELLQETTDGDMISVVKLAARLAEAEECARSYEAEANQLREVSKANRERTKVTEAEVKRLRNKVAVRALTDEQLRDEISAIDETCKGGFGEGGGSPGEWWYERADELEHERKRRDLEKQLERHNSRTDLSATGGEHADNR